MRNLSIAIRLWAATVLLISLTGCDSQPAQVSVRGKVFYKGQPLSKGTIVFAPDAKHGNHAPLASAEIQADGSYCLRTGETPGAAVGWHRVTVVAVETPAQSSTGRRFSVPISLVPEKYRDPQLSGLSCEVQIGKEDGYDFRLE